MTGHRGRAWAVAVAVAVAAALALSGCSSASDELTQSRKDALAAVSSASAATALYRDGKALAPWLATQYGDQLKELSSAEQSAAELDTQGSATAERTGLLHRIRAGIEALKAAQRALDAGRTPSGTALRDAREALR